MTLPFYDHPDAHERESVGGLWARYIDCRPDVGVDASGFEPEVSDQQVVRYEDYFETEGEKDAGSN